MTLLSLCPAYGIPETLTMNSIRPANETDIPRVMTVLEAAKGIMRASGNMNQWVNGYP